LKIKNLLVLIFALYGACYAQSFVKVLGENSVNDGPTCFKDFGEFSILAGYAGNKSFLKKMNFLGETEWTVYYEFTESFTFISDFIIDNNFLVGCGYGHDSGGKIFTDFYFKMDLKTQNMQWVKNTNLTLKPNSINLLENGNYLIAGDEYVNHKFGIFLLTILPKNGKKENFTTWYFSGRESASVSLLDGQTLYTAGRYALVEKEEKYRGAISAFDAYNFRQKWTKYYLNSRNADARNYLSNLILDNDTLVAAFFTNNKNTSSNYTISFAKISKQGELHWAFEYMLEGYTNLTVRDMKATQDGYIIFGYTKAPEENIFVLKLNKEGYVQWTKIYGENLSDVVLSDQGNFMFVKDDYLFFAAQSRNVSSVRDFNTVLIKTQLAPNEDNCWGKPINVAMFSYMELIEGEINLTRVDTVFKISNASFSKLNLEQTPSFFHCLGSLAVNDYDTIFYPENSIKIDFLNNDLIGISHLSSVEISVPPTRGTAEVKGACIHYFPTDVKDCFFDSLQYTLHADNGASGSAKIYIYKVFISEDTLPVQLSLEGEATLFVEAEPNKIQWPNQETGNTFQVNQPGWYWADIRQAEGCIYRQYFEVVENMYSFDEVAFNNITFVLDVSLSMNRADRLPLLKDAFYNIIQYMRADDNFSVVTYSSNTEILFDGIAANNIDMVKSKIDPLIGAGQSNVNLLKSATLAYQLAGNNYKEAGNNRIIFTTDGNISKEKRAELKSFLQKQKKANVYFTIFLFNTATLYKDQMQELADATGAQLYVISQDNINSVLLNEFKAIKKGSYE
jgi:hypothetical protein